MMRSGDGAYRHFWLGNGAVGPAAGSVNLEKRVLLIINAAETEDGTSASRSTTWRDATGIFKKLEQRVASY
jgi:hypothetical protein